MRCGELHKDVTREVDLVWVPGAPPQPGVNQDLESGPAPPVVPPVNQFGVPIVAPPGSGPAYINEDVQDRHTGLSHQPLNRGENNQTGQRGKRIYQTRLINGKKYTVDRSRAWPRSAKWNLIEHHKEWYVDRTGAWRRYEKHAEIDWDDKDLVEALNKWREQVYDRHGGQRSVMESARATRMMNSSSCSTTSRRRTGAILISASKS